MTTRHHRSIQTGTAIALVKPEGSDEWVWRYRHQGRDIDFADHIAKDADEFIAWLRTYTRGLVLE